MEHYSTFFIIPDAPRIHFSLLFPTLLTFSLFMTSLFYVYTPWEMMKIVFAFYSRSSPSRWSRCDMNFNFNWMWLKWQSFNVSRARDAVSKFPSACRMLRNFEGFRAWSLSWVNSSLLAATEAINQVTSLSSALRTFMPRCKTSERNHARRPPRHRTSAIKDKKGSTFELILRSTLDFFSARPVNSKISVMTMAEIISYKFFIRRAILFRLFHPFKSEDIPNEGKMAEE